MGLLARAVAETKAADPLALWAEIARAGRTSKAGPTINLESAFQVSALFGCLLVLSRGVAQVPFKLFQEQTVDGLRKIEPAREHPLYDLVATQPNDWSTSFEFRETMTIHAALGDAYAFKNVVRGELLELILLNPGKVKPVQNADWSITYEVTGSDGQTKPFAQEAIWHVRGPSWNGFSGMQILSVARDALGLSIALNDSLAGLHANGVRSSGVYSVDGNLSAEAHAKLVAWLKREAAASPGAPMVLDRSAKWLQTAMTSVDAQHAEMRRMQIEEVCRFLGVSPHKVYSSDKTSTYASAEQFNIQHVVDTLGPWYARIEQSADVNLLTKKERAQGYYHKFIAAGLLRGAAKDRGEYYAKALGSGGSQGWMTPDEVRALEELNPMGGEAAKLPAPSNKQPDPAGPSKP